MPPRASLKKRNDSQRTNAYKSRRTQISNDIRKNKKCIFLQAKRCISTAPIPASERISIAFCQEWTKVLNEASAPSTSFLVEHVQKLRSHLEATDINEFWPFNDALLTKTLVELLRYCNNKDDTSSAFFTELCACLVLTSEGSEAERIEIIKAVPMILCAAQSEQYSYYESAVIAIGNMAAEHESICATFVSQNLVDILMAHTQSQCQNEAKLAFWALYIVAQRHSHIIVEQMVKSNAIETFFISGDDVLAECAWLFSILTSKSDIFLTKFLEKDLLSTFITYLSRDLNDYVLIPILRVLGNVCCALQANIHRFVSTYAANISKESLLDALKMILEKYPRDLSLISETLWALSKFVCVCTIQDDTILLYEVVPLVIRIFIGDDWECSRESCFALTNVALCDVKYMQCIMRTKEDRETILLRYISLLRAPDLEIVVSSLQFIENALCLVSEAVPSFEQMDGIEALENVQYGELPEWICQCAENIVNQFYGESYGQDSASDDDDCQESLSGRGRGLALTLPAWM